MSDVTIKRLHDLELFSGCKHSELDQIDRLLVTVDVPAGRTLCAEGGYGREFFVLVDGVANVHSSDGHAALLTAGTWFGDQALLDRAPRSATVTTITDVTVLVFSRREFGALMSRFPTVRARLQQRPSIDLEPARVGTPPSGPTPGALALGAVSGR